MPIAAVHIVQAVSSICTMTQHPNAQSLTCTDEGAAMSRQPPKSLPPNACCSPNTGAPPLLLGAATPSAQLTTVNCLASCLGRAAISSCASCTEAAAPLSRTGTSTVSLRPPAPSPKPLPLPLPPVFSCAAMAAAACRTASGRGSRARCVLKGTSGKQEGRRQQRKWAARKRDRRKGGNGYQIINLFTAATHCTPPSSLARCLHPRHRCLRRQVGRMALG